MLKNIWLKVFLSLLIIAAMFSDSAAQTRIRFGRGRTSATVSGNIGVENGRDYILRVAAGQTMSVKIHSANGAVTANAGTASGKDFTFSLDNDGDVEITVSNSGRHATRYTMTITVR
ncbi:MAG: hypothetical protein M3033_14245 [Acidobacteriota bacterium]|nr:hypothetical protein [Acidobacteriota bacterium]